LAALARRCHRALKVHGKAGLPDEACRDFERKALPVLEGIDQEAWLKAGETADAARSWAAKVEWDIFWRRVQTDWDDISKTSDHLEFMRK
jgi:hypothetical protein